MDWIIVYFVILFFTYGAVMTAAWRGYQKGPKTRFKFVIWFPLVTSVLWFIFWPAFFGYTMLGSEKKELSDGNDSVQITS
jgi:hypothetical protein